MTNASTYICACAGVCVCMLELAIHTGLRSVQSLTASALETMLAACSGCFMLRESDLSASKQLRVCLESSKFTNQ